ncbi:MAG: LamG-like jellyroll fold domain-containing protein [Alphaproteobacteria bacterium]
MRVRSLCGALLWVLVAPAQSDAAEGGLLFQYTADHGFAADTAQGQAEPLFRDRVKIIDGGAAGKGVEAANDQILAWSAPGNIYAEQGTLSFFWRAREALGRNQFPIFRVGYSDHSSWDMVFLRIDWNGHGFDAFVTDNNLARVRVSFEVAEVPKPEQWVHLAFAWDQARGVRLYVDGRLAARKDQPAVLDAGLYGFGPHSRIISPMQVQSRYNFMRGGDIDEIEIFDRALDDSGMAALARHERPHAAPLARSLAEKALRNAWWLRHGWTKSAPPYLKASSTAIRKVEFADARDIKQWMWKGTDGIRETTWPNVYNRSRLPGRHDYFELPDWNTYSTGGRSLTLTLPSEPFNRVEIEGAAFGVLTHVGDLGSRRLMERKAGVERTVTDIGEALRGGKLRFENKVPETPIQEIAAYYVAPGGPPADAFTLSYTVNAKASTDYPTLGDLNAYIAGRYMADERSRVVALPEGAPKRDGVAPALSLPLVHILVPADFRVLPPGGPVVQYSYGWENLNAGLDGIVLELPAMKLKATHGGRVPLNIRVLDPIWPDRALMDINVSVKPGEARRLWLDTRDRLLPNDRSLYLTIAAAGGDFGPGSLDGAKIRLVFKPRQAATAEHVADRFSQIRDNTAFFIEEHTNTKNLPLFARFVDDITDLFRADPDHYLARTYWAQFNPEQTWPPFEQPLPPVGVPLWAYRQAIDLKLYQHFADWWIDNRQIETGEFGGGLSDDTDLTNQWPPLALMGADPDKIRGSLDLMVDGIYANGMITNGLNTIKTDELHSYEEGINGISQAAMVSGGNPEAIERLMATARNYDRLTAVNAKGHRHIVTNYFNATDFVREGVWEWAKPPSHLILHPGILLVEYNGNPQLRKLILEVADGYLAHGKPQPDGTYVFPFDINWRTDEERGRGVERAIQIFWAAYRWTGDEKYLRPLYGEVRDRGPGALGILNADVIGRLKKEATWGRTLREQAQETGEPFALYEAWRTTGDKAYLERLYGDQIREGSQAMYMMTEGEWWSDRVEYPGEELQRSRLGGVALIRNQITPGYLVSWRFSAPATAASVALLVRQPAPEKLAVIGFNLEEKAVRAAMTPWDLPAGTWSMTSGVDRNGDDKPDAPSAAREIVLERSRPVDLEFPPGETTAFEFALTKPNAPVSERPDLGIGPKDIRFDKNALVVSVHNLGAVEASKRILSIEDTSGRSLAQAPVPPIAAPIDLAPKTTEIRVALPAGGEAERSVCASKAKRPKLRS